RLSGDAHFSLKLGDTSATPVVVMQSDTANNHSIDDLVGEINTAIGKAAGTALASVRAAVVNGKIVFTTNSASSGKALQISVSAGDPAATQLGFTDGQSAQGRSAGLFIENASVNGEVNVKADDIQAAARLGPVSVHIGQGTAQGKATAALELKGQGGTARFDPF